ncbi:iron-containing alcohol dehydrogenase [Aminipila butyrica]|uniref:Iron-containing alcohol dehydrogenase n=1 Tax=Aminipila butyrica TaxID=433296 RepID=A0A858BS59_9FIRM|nr:iron-containing alcohol dehydrogenase [Aminipila butyrica]QIB67945.1 iron-containing alcohol dehydrogenase [Aminipila butyrica]
MMNFEFSMPTEIIFGREATLKIGQLAEKYGKKVLIHYGSKRIEENGILDQITALLAERQLESIKLGGVRCNPQVELAQKGVRLCKKEGVQLILAIGGGSVIDSAKAIAMGACSEAPVWDLYKNAVKVDRALPIGAVVTIPASASECNGMSVLSNDQTGEKRALYCRYTLPRFAILNPEYTLSLPRYNTAVAAVDIFSHAFERYVDLRRGSFLWDGLCESLMRTVVELASKLMANPTDYNLRSELMWTAAMAHNNMLGPGGDFACHGLAHPLTGEYGLAHGAALAIILPAWCRYVNPRHPEKFQAFAQGVWGVGSGEDAVACLVDFIENLGLAVDLKTVGIHRRDSKKEAKRLAAMACPTGNSVLGGGLELVDRESAEAIYDLAFEGPIAGMKRS